MVGVHDPVFFLFLLSSVFLLPSFLHLSELGPNPAPRNSHNQRQHRADFPFRNPQLLDAVEKMLRSRVAANG
jgi:hypothetical protein